MSSAAKTFKLLSYFSAARPEIGLSQFCRLANRDKATTYRHLQALEETGFVEKNPVSKRYRLGPIILQLAKTREATVPRKAGVEDPLRELSDSTGETTHASMLSGSTLYVLDQVESPQHSARVVVDIQTLPLHATASGLCALAFGSPDLTIAATQSMAKYTEHTVVTEPELESAIKCTRETGFGVANRSLEDDVYGISAPVFDQTGLLAGAVSVASIASRVTPETEQKIRLYLMNASRKITCNWGGTLPEEIETLWAGTFSRSHQLESTP